MTKRPKQHQPVPIKGIARVLIALIEHPVVGATEGQIAAVSDMSPRKVHRAIVAMSVNGLVRVHPTRVDDRITVNLDHELLDPFLELLSGRISRDADWVERILKLGEHGVSVAVDWRSHRDRPVDVLAVVPNDIPDERVLELRTHLEHEIGRRLRTPRIRVLTWADYRHLLKAGDAAARQIWRRGDQVAGDAPVTRAALRSKLRWSLIDLRIDAEAHGQVSGRHS